ncbi:hypothetical protein [Flavihumibacter solisilvae]|uniref:Uncharacterized protein n=1 Tax=Flavihumibacter solisilvae TaxID=1349421 RepID=A0A0C1IUH8_9BACT|nr:hypothetical protein [Flavihumibacter solisilvae]KIC94139.1 hypothetical protein OI18_14225 [Flavihumibacter solisilvae]
MNDQHQIEAQLWEYIDGLSTPEERGFIEQLIASDQLWRSKYEELLQFNKSLNEEIELEQPSMRFTKNVMEEIARLHIAPAAKTYINKNIIYGIAGFMISLIVGFVIYAIAQIDWSAAATEPGRFTMDLSRIDFSRIDTSKIFSNTYVNAFMLVNVVLGLMLLDRYLAQQRKSWKKEGSGN